MIVRPRRCISPQGFLALLPRHRSRLLSEMHRLPHQLRHGIWEWYWWAHDNAFAHQKNMSNSHGIYQQNWTHSKLSGQSTLILTHSFVTSRLDSANSLLSNLPECDTNQLQRIQNISARITERVRRTAHITPILHKLHWLPVIKRTRFKVLLLTYKALHGLAPAYISELIQQHTSRRALRSQDQHLLQVPRTRTQYYGSRTFSAVVPTLWNSLPLHTNY